MNSTTQSIDYENFVRYFESEYLNELSMHRVYEHRIHFLMNLKQLANQHKYRYEVIHGQGSYKANLGKYGGLQRTPTEIIEGDLNCTHLMMPKISHNYITRFGCFSYAKKRFV